MFVIQWLGAALWAGSLLFAFSLVQYTLEARLIVPFSDEWDFLAWYRNAAEGGITFSGLWEPVNGHRQLIPRLLFFVRDAWFAGDPLVLILGSLLLQVCVIAMIVVALLREPRLDGTTVQPVAIATTIMLLTWSVQLENFQWGVQITYLLATCLAVAAIAVLSSEPPPAVGFDRPAACATAFALAACLCLGAGLSAWPALLVVAIAHRRGAFAVAMIAAGAVVSVTWYVGSISSEARPLDMVDVSIFLARYVAPPFIREIYALLIGGALIGVGVFAMTFALLRGLPGRLAGIALGLVAFGLSTALLTAVSRSEFAYSRYVSFGLLYWVGLLLLGALVAGTSGRFVRWAVGASVLAGILRFPVATQAEATQPFVDRADRTTAAALSMVVGTPDAENIRLYLYPRPQVALELLPFLLERGYGFFGDPLVRAVGRPASEMFEIGSGVCPVTIEAAAAPAGLRLSGRFDDKAGPPWLIVVDSNGLIRGLAARGRRTSEIAGYAVATALPSTLFGVRGKTLCRAGVMTGPGNG
jgi:hypothetical protein